MALVPIGGQLAKASVPIAWALLGCELSKLFLGSSVHEVQIESFP